MLETEKEPVSNANNKMWIVYLFVICHRSDVEQEPILLNDAIYIVHYFGKPSAFLPSEMIVSRTVGSPLLTVLFLDPKNS